MFGEQFSESLGSFAFRALDVVSDEGPLGVFALLRADAATAVENFNVRQPGDDELASFMLRLVALRPQWPVLHAQILQGWEVVQSVDVSP